jgi:myo-inositol-1(or 4)-monophosphatase
MQYREICSEMRKVVNEAAVYVRSRHENRTGMNIEVKGKQNYVTEVDKKAEEILVDGLTKIIPESGFIAEEGTSDRRGTVFNWVIDPIDGTTNFIHGVFPFAISVGLMEEQEVVAGVIYEFGLDETFYSWKGGGAWLNGKPIRVSEVETLDGCLIATGFPYTNFKYMDEFMNSMNYFMKNSHGLRRLGSAATDIAYVACGRYDGFYEYGLHPWDIAAGVLLVKEAGGEVSDFEGSGELVFSENIVCSNRNCFIEFLDTIQKLMVPR